MESSPPLRRLAPLAFALFALALSPTAARAQRVASYDFSTQSPKDRVRQPKPFPPGIQLGGRCGGILGNPPLRVSLLSLDKTEYAVGDDVIFTIAITNTGSTPQRAPVAFNLADMEPPDASQNYNYQPMEIWLHLVKPSDSPGIQFFSTLALTLYGSDDRPDTQFELRKGEWIEIRGRTKLVNTSASQKRYFADSEVYSSIRNVTGKISDMTAGVFSWRGDDVHFEGRTQYEYVGCHGYEMSGGGGSSLHLDLLPATPSNSKPLESTP
jgi:hypothetical protein